MQFTAINRVVDFYFAYRRTLQTAKTNFPTFDYQEVLKSNIIWMYISLTRVDIAPILSISINFSTFAPNVKIVLSPSRVYN